MPDDHDGDAHPMPHILLSDGYRDPHTAKTAICVIRYRPEEVVAVLDRGRGRADQRPTAGRGRGDSRRGALADAPAADTLLLGIAPPGGKIPAALAADRAGGRPARA